MNLLSHLRNDSVWALHPTAHDALAAGIRTLAAGRSITTDEFEKFTAAQKAKLRQVNGHLAVIPVHGVIEQRTGYLSYYYGGCGCEDLGMAINDHLANDKVSAIMLHCDSPGGSSYGVQELSDMIYAARSTKPIISICDSMMASAGYWIGSSAERCLMTPGGDVGSVGVYMMHCDYSGMLTEAGIKVQFIQAGQFKTEGNPYEPLSDEAQAHLQDEVNYCYAAFTKSVARNRGTDVKAVRDNYGQGRCLNADAAKKAGMIDRVITFQKALAELFGTGPEAQKLAKAVDTELLRLRQAARKRKMPTS
jgi:signal peptide peptidase SppA